MNFALMLVVSLVDIFKHRFVDSLIYLVVPILESYLEVSVFLVEVQDIPS